MAEKLLPFGRSQLRPKWTGEFERGDVVFLGLKLREFEKGELRVES